MRLTQAGEALVRHASGILAGLTAAEEEVAAIAGLRAGRVRLVSFPSGSSTLVPGALAALRAEHPGTRVSLVEAEPPRSVDLLREGDCDIALAFRYGATGGRMGRPGGPAAAHRPADRPPPGGAPAGGGAERVHRRAGRGVLDRGLPALAAASSSTSARSPVSPRASTSPPTTTRR